MVADSARPAPFFIADSRALDFLNSVAAPSGDEIDWLSDGIDLLSWLEQSGLIAQSVLIEFRQQVPPQELNSIAAKARELREWFRQLVMANAGQSLRAPILKHLDPINGLLAQDHGYRQLEITEQDQDTPALRWRQDRRWLTADMLLLPLAEAIGDLVCDVDFLQLKNCEGPTCTLWFVDVSKNHTRRWCSMAVCGNRAKAAAHRAKKRSKS